VNACAANIAGTRLPIMPGFVRRFDSDHAGVRRAIATGRIGALHQVAITSRDPDMAPDAYIEASGGVFRDMTIHDFDMARFILAEATPRSVRDGRRVMTAELG
jgi:myo-inositol 2-dehydrogenase/D-chiro-inositol 1-dehydrogenase